MEIFDKISALVPTQNYGPKNVGLLGSTPKNPVSNNASNNKTTKVNEDEVLISQNAKNAIEKNSQKSTGSIVVNNNRISYSLSENNDLVIRIIDKDSKEVIRQIPPEEMVKVKAALQKVLEQSSKNIEV